MDYISRRMAEIRRSPLISPAAAASLENYVRRQQATGASQPTRASQTPSAFDLAQMQIQEQRRIAEQQQQQLQQQMEQQRFMAEQQIQEQRRIAEQRMQQMEQQRQQQLNIAQQQMEEQRRVTEQQMQQQRRQLQISTANQGMAGSGQVQFSQSKADRKKLTSAGTAGYFGRQGLRIKGLNVAPTTTSTTGSFA